MACTEVTEPLRVEVMRSCSWPISDCSHRQAGQRDTHTRSGRLVHLAEDEHRLVDDARLGHFDPEVVALTRALADTAEGGQSAVLLGEVVNELLNQDGLADAGAAEQADLAALGVRREQVDDLDAGLEHLRRRSQVLDVRRIAMDGPTFLDLDGRTLIDRLAEQVEDASERDVADRDRDRSASVDDLDAARQAVGGVHGNATNAVVAQVLLDLDHELASIAAVDLERVVDRRQPVREDGLDDDALDLFDPAGVRLCLGLGLGFCCSHCLVGP